MDRDRTPEGRFTYLAVKRVDKVMGAIESLAKLSDRKNYSYTQNQVDQIFEALDDAYENLKSEFSRKQRAGNAGFQFKTVENSLIKGLSEVEDQTKTK